MKMPKSLVLSTAAVLALGLSACSDGSSDVEPTPDPATTVATEEAPVEETPTEEAPVEETPAEPEEPAEPAEPAGDFPFEEGPVDVDEFTARYAEAMEGVQYATVTTESPEAGSQVVQVDNTDPANPRSYSVSQMDGQEMEMIIEGTTSWTRIDGGEWTEGQVPEGANDIVAQMAGAFESIELVNAADRQFLVTIPLGGVEGEPMEAMLWVDEQFRAERMEIELMGTTSVSTYDFDTPAEIPTVE